MKLSDSLEIIYLWIDNYRNFNNQEFFFDKNHNIKVSKKLIKKTKDRDKTIVENIKITSSTKNKVSRSIFTDKNHPIISNVNAVVGINGSGKSTLLRFLCEELLSTKVIKSSCFAIFKQDESFLIVSEEDKDVELGNSCLEFSKQIKEQYNTYTFSDFFKEKIYKICYVSNIFDGERFYSSIPNVLDLSTNKRVQEAENIDMFKTQEVAENAFLYMRKNTPHIKNIPLKLPQSLTIKMNFNQRKIIGFYDQEKIKELADNFPKYVDNIQSMSFSRFHEMVDISILWCEVLSRNDQGMDIGEIKISHKIASFKKKFEELFKDFTPSINLNNENPFEIKENQYADKYTNPNNTSFTFNIANRKDSIYIIERLHDLLLDYTNLVEHFKYHFLEFTWNGLSSGENALLTIFSRLHYQFHKGINKNILLLIDEADTYLHVDWQKKFIKILLQGLEDIFPTQDTSIQIILTTHSPIILSDIPHTNICYLPHNDISLEEVERKKTFGANIYNLFNNSFFLQNGVLGNFAHSKIQEIISFHNKVLNTHNDNIKELQKEYNDIKTDIKHTTSIIGEEMIVNILNNHIDEIENILLDNAEKNKNRIQELEKELERLKKNKND